MTEPRPLSPRVVLWTQIVTWSVFFLIMAVRLPAPPHPVPLCPSVWGSFTGSGGIPRNWAGIAFGITATGVLWYLSGVLAWVYGRWPRYFFVFRVLAARAMGPMARKLGLIVTGTGLALGVLLQVGCELTG